MTIEFCFDDATGGEQLAVVCEGYVKYGWEIVNIYPRLIDGNKSYYEVLFKQDFPDEAAIASDTAARAEITRLTAALAESAAAQRTFKEGWNACIAACECDVKQNAIDKLTAENAALADALRIADAGWSEAIDVCDEKQRVIDDMKRQYEDCIPF